MVRKALSDKVTFNQRLEESEFHEYLEKRISGSMLGMFQKQQEGQCCFTKGLRGPVWGKKKKVEVVRGQIGLVLFFKESL